MPPGVGPALAAIALWSTLAALGVKLSGVPPLKLTGTALLVGGLCGLPFWRQWRAGPRLLALGLYGLFGYHLVFFLALRLAPPVEANLVNDLWPLLIVLLAPLFDARRRLTARHALAGLMGFAGAALLAGGGAGFAGSHWPGFVLALAAAVIWSTYSLATARLGEVPSGVVGLFCLASGALALLGHVVLEPSHSWAAGELPLAAAMGLGPTGLAFYAWDAAMKRGDPRLIGVLSYLVPLGSTLLLAASGAGALTPSVWLAMALIVGGAALGTSAPCEDLTKGLEMGGRAC